MGKKFHGDENNTNDFEYSYLLKSVALYAVVIYICSEKGDMDISIVILLQ